MQIRTLAYKFELDPTKQQARELDRWCSVSRYAWNWALAEYESALDEVRACDPDADGKRATGSVRDVLEKRMLDLGLSPKAKGKRKEDDQRTISLAVILGKLWQHHRDVHAPAWVAKDVHSQVSGYAVSRLCETAARWWAAKGRRTPWITSSERRAGKRSRRGPGAKGSQGKMVGPPRYKRNGQNPSWTFQAPKERSGRLVSEDVLDERGEKSTRKVRVGKMCARDVLVDRRSIRLPMKLGRVRIADATSTAHRTDGWESPLRRIPKDAIPKVVTIRKVARTRWEVSIVVQEPWQVPDMQPTLPRCGIDLGIHAQATIAWSDGRIERVEPPRPMANLGVGLVMLQKKLSRSQHWLRCVGCGNKTPLGRRDKRTRICRAMIERDGQTLECGGRVRRWRSWRGMKILERIAQKHHHIERVRADHLHRLTHRLVHEASAICTEPHNVTGLVSAGVARRVERLYKRGLARKDIRRAMLDIGWGEFRRQIAYKAPWQGKEYVTMPQGSVTDQACNRCGCENKMPDNTSEYLCSNCHWHGTRQENTSLLCLGYIEPAHEEAAQ